MNKIVAVLMAALFSTSVFAAKHTTAEAPTGMAGTEAKKEAPAGMSGMAGMEGKKEAKKEKKAKKNKKAKKEDAAGMSGMSGMAGMDAKKEEPKK